MLNPPSQPPIHTLSDMLWLVLRAGEGPPVYLVSIAPPSMAASLLERWKVMRGEWVKEQAVMEDQLSP